MLIKCRLPDASVDPTLLAADIAEIAKIGGGGIQFLNYFSVRRYILTTMTVMVDRELCSMEANMANQLRTGLYTDLELPITMTS